MKKFAHNLRFNSAVVALFAFARQAHGVLTAFAALTAISAYEIIGHSISLAPLALGLVADDKSTLDERLAKSLDAIDLRLGKVDQMEKALGEHKTAYDEVTKVLIELKASQDAFKKQMLEIGTARQRRGGEVSEGCARHLGAIWLAAALKTPSTDMTESQKAMAAVQIKNILGMELKAALTSSDIPLPTVYSAEIVEFVFQYGLARKVGTVFPLGALTVKLPKLSTDPTFGLIATSGTVTEKSPQVAFVTFTAEKFGGLIRLPQEIDEDSIVAMGQFLARYTARQIAYVEDYQFFVSTGAGSGLNGTGQGLLKAVVVDSCSYVQGGATTSGKTKISDGVLADYRNLRSSSTLSGAALGNAAYYCHPTYEALFVSFNTSATVTPYIRGTKDTPATLDGFPIIWSPTMPVYNTSATVTVCHALFGDVTYQYLGLRNGIRFDTSRDAAFATDEILVRALERMTVGLMASKAVAGLITSTS